MRSVVTMAVVFPLAALLILGCSKYDETAPAAASATNTDAATFPTEGPYKPRPEDYIVKVEIMNERGNTEAETCTQIESNASNAAVHRAWGSLRVVKGAGECHCQQEQGGVYCERKVYIGAITTSGDGIPKNDDGTPIKGIVE